MTKLVACIFHAEAEAEAARRDLLACGFKAEQIEVHGHVAAPPRANREGDDLEKAVEGIFDGLIPDADETARYVQAVNEGKRVVVLHAPDDTAAARAASILREAGGTPSSESDPLADASGPRVYSLADAPGS